MKVIFKISFALCLITLLANCNNTSNKKLSQPNIVWIVSEDNSPFIGCYGDTIAITPNIDRLAEEGILFENAFANAPVCAPSRSTLITGMYPTTLGSQHMRSNVKVPENVKFFPRYLKDAGYYTTLRIKRDYNIPKQDGTWDKDNFWHMKDALEGKEDDQPFFMFYNTWMTHEGKVQDESSLPDYFKSTFENDSNVNTTLQSFTNFNSQTVIIPEYQPDIPEMRDAWALYYKAMQMMDYEVGRIIQYLKDNNLIENTIIIYSSDHGGVLGRSKRFNYESGLHIPMIVWAPGKYKNVVANINEKRTNRMVSFVDMAPTILSLAGIEKPDYMHGKAFLGVNAQHEDTIAYGFRGRMDEAYDIVRTVRTKQYRYIRNYMPYRPNGQHLEFLWKAKSIEAWEDHYKNGLCNDMQSAFFEPRPPEELYDIVSDPDNIHNLANSTEYSTTLTQLRDINRNLIRKYSDTGFIPEGEFWQRSNKGAIAYKEIIDTDKDELIAAINAAEKATLYPNLEDIKLMLESKYSTVRFWGATGCIILEDEAMSLKAQLIHLLNDNSGDVAVTSAEALYLLGDKKLAIKSLYKALDSENIYVQLRALNIVANRKISDEKLILKIESMDKSNQYINSISKYIISINK